MKIALVCPYNMLDRPGGVPQVVIHLHEGLKKKGHTVKVVTQRPSGYKGKVPEDYRLFGITRAFKVSGFGTEGNWGMPADSDEIANYLEQEKFDVINFHEPWLPMLAWQWWAIAMLPMAMDGVTQMLGLRESTLALRLMTGILFGLVTAWFALPQIGGAAETIVAEAIVRYPDRPVPMRG